MPSIPPVVSRAQRDLAARLANIGSENAQPIDRAARNAIAREFPFAATVAREASIVAMDDAETELYGSGLFRLTVRPSRPRFGADVWADYFKRAAEVFIVLGLAAAILVGNSDPIAVWLVALFFASPSFVCFYIERDILRRAAIGDAIPIPVSIPVPDQKESSRGI